MRYGSTSEATTSRPRRTPSSSAARRIGSSVGAMFRANTNAPPAATSSSPTPPGICSDFSPPLTGASATPTEKPMLTGIAVRAVDAERVLQRGPSPDPVQQRSSAGGEQEGKPHPDHGVLHGSVVSAPAGTPRSRKAPRSPRTCRPARRGSPPARCSVRAATSPGCTAAAPPGGRPPPPLASRLRRPSPCQPPRNHLTAEPDHGFPAFGGLIRRTVLLGWDIHPEKMRKAGWTPAHHHLAGGVPPSHGVEGDRGGASAVDPRGGYPFSSQ